MNPVNVNREPVLAPDLAARVSRVGLVLAVLGLGAGFALGAAEGDNLRHFFWAYLVGFAFFFTFTLGGLFFVLVQHVTGAKWSVSVRRMGEFAMNTVPALGIMAIPLLYPLLTNAGREEFGGLLWPWVQPHGEHADLVAMKEPFLNVPFFIGRMVFYLLVWWLMARFFMKRSLQQDTDRDPAYAPTIAMRKLSAPGIIVFALTLSFASFDWLMSTAPEWFSTIFGVYIFAGCVLTIHAWLVISSVFLQKQGYMKKEVNAEHYHDLGKFMTAFTVFWAYIAFSQFMLIWYANLPEETGFFHSRTTEAWKTMSYLLIVTNFFVPFFGFLSRHVKRKPKMLAMWAVYVLIVHWLDLYWLVMPSMSPESNPFGLIEVATTIGAFGLFLWAFARQGVRHSVLAYGDPKLGDCLAHENY